MRVTASTPIGRIAQMGAAFAASNVVRGGITFLTSLVVGRALGRDGFGAWTFCLAWVSTLIVLFDLGFGVLLTREAARAEGELGRLVATALLGRLALFAPAAVAFWAAAPWLALSDATTIGLRLGVVAAAAGLAYGCFAAPLRARPDWLLVALSIEAASAVAQLASSWWLLARGDGLIGLLSAFAIIQVVQLLLAVGLFAFVTGCAKLEWPGRRSALALVRRGIPFALSGLVANGQVRLAPLMLGYLSTAGELASFGAAWRLGNLMRALPYAAFSGALPVLAREAALGAEDTVRRRFDDAVGVFAAVAALFVALGAAPILVLTYGAKFKLAAPALVWVAAGLVPSLVNSGRKVALYAVGKERTVLGWSSISLAIQFCGCAALIPQFGAAGAATALFAGEALVWWPLRNVTQNRTSGASTAREAANLPSTVGGELRVEG